MAVVRAPCKEERERAVLLVLPVLTVLPILPITPVLPVLPLLPALPVLPLLPVLPVLSVLPVLQALYKKEKARTSYYLFPLPHPSVTRQYAPWTAAHQSYFLRSSCFIFQIWQNSCIVFGIRSMPEELSVLTDEYFPKALLKCFQLWSN